MNIKPQRDEIINFISEYYGDKPEYLWKKTPDCAVFRHQTNRKWYGIIMNIPYEKLDTKTAGGLHLSEQITSYKNVLMCPTAYEQVPIKEENQGKVDIINVKCDHIMLGSLLEENGFFPAYHMNKTHWISIVLDGRVDIQKIKTLIDISYELTDVIS